MYFCAIHLWFLFVESRSECFPEKDGQLASSPPSLEKMRGRRTAIKLRKDQRQKTQEDLLSHKSGGGSTCYAQLSTTNDSHPPGRSAQKRPLPSANSLCTFP